MPTPQSVFLEADIRERERAAELLHWVRLGGDPASPFSLFRLNDPTFARDADGLRPAEGDAR